MTRTARAATGVKTTMMARTAMMKKEKAARTVQMAKMEKVTMTSQARTETELEMEPTKIQNG